MCPNDRPSTFIRGTHFNFQVELIRKGIIYFELGLTSTLTILLVPVAQVYGFDGLSGSDCERPAGLRLRVVLAESMQSYLFRGSDL